MTSRPKKKCLCGSQGIGSKLTACGREAKRLNVSSDDRTVNCRKCLKLIRKGNA